MSTPEDRTGTHNSLCEYGMRPILLDGMFRYALTEHFRSPDNIEHSQLLGRVWSEDGACQLRIECNTVWKPTTADQRPAIIIKGNDMEAKKLGVNNQAGFTQSGHSEFTKLWQGTHTLFCLSTEGGEAQILGAEVARYLMHWGPEFRKVFQLAMFELVQVGAVGKLKEAPDVRCVPVTVGYAWTDSWVLRQHVPLFKTLTFGELFPPQIG